MRCQRADAIPAGRCAQPTPKHQPSDIAPCTEPDKKGGAARQVATPPAKQGGLSVALYEPRLWLVYSFAGLVNTPFLISEVIPPNAGDTAYMRAPPPFTLISVSIGQPRGAVSRVRQQTDSISGNAGLKVIPLYLKGRGVTDETAGLLASVLTISAIPSVLLCSQIFPGLSTRGKQLLFLASHGMATGSLLALACFPLMPEWLMVVCFAAMAAGLAPTAYIPVCSPEQFTQRQGISSYKTTLEGGMFSLSPG